jgi:hypothetical protein
LLEHGATTTAPTDAQPHAYVAKLAVNTLDTVERPYSFRELPYVAELHSSSSKLSPF